MFFPKTILRNIDSWRQSRSMSASQAATQVTPRLVVHWLSSRCAVIDRPPPRCTIRLTGCGLVAAVARCGNCKNQKFRTLYSQRKLKWKKSSCGQLSIMSIDFSDSQLTSLNHPKPICERPSGPRRPAEIMEIDQVKLLICPTWFGLMRGEAADLPGLFFFQVLMHPLHPARSGPATF